MFYRLHAQNGPVADLVFNPRRRTLLGMAVGATAPASAGIQSVV